MSSQVKSSRRLPMNDAGYRRHTQFGEVRTNYLFGTAYAGMGVLRVSESVCQ